MASQGNKLIDVPFIHDFYLESFPSNKDKLIDFIESGEEDNTQDLSWTDLCSLEVQGITGDNPFNYLAPVLKEFIGDLGLDILKINLRLTGIWRNTYRRGDFQEVHDHNYDDISGVIFLTDEQEDDGRFYFSNKSGNEIPFSWYKLREDNERKIHQRRHYIKAERGKVILFPSYLQHGVTVHKSDNPRRTAAFNLQFLE